MLVPGNTLEDTGKEARRYQGWKLRAQQWQSQTVSAEQLRLREVGPSALGGESNGLGRGCLALSHHGNGSFSLHAD